MHKQDGKWLFNETDGELWCGDFYDTKEEAIAAARRDGLSEFYVGQFKLTELPHIDAERLMDDLADQVFDEAGEFAENYLDDVTEEQIKELEQKLNAVFAEWSSAHCLDPDFGTIVRIETVKYPEPEEA